jgi:hypothetical protein
MNKPLIYLASPYSHKDKLIMKERENEVCQIAWNLIKEGFLVYCPIAETAAIAKHASVDNTGWEFWREKDLKQLSRCDELYVATLSGWQTSRGIRGEVKWWLKNKNRFSVYTVDLAGVIQNESQDSMLEAFEVNTVECLND